MKYFLKLGDVSVTSDAEPVTCSWEKSQSQLLVNRSGERLPIPPVARHLARILKPEGEHGALPSGLKDALGGESAGEASELLSTLGYPVLDDDPELVTTPGEAVQPGGTAEDESGSPSESNGKRSEASDSHGENRQSEETEIEQSGELAEAMTGNNKGFDIRSETADGDVRYIEVKSVSGEWDRRNIANVKKAQFEMAQDKGEAFWLYVVENARKEGQRELYTIQNPAAKVSEYLFDHGWKDFASGDTSPPEAAESTEVGAEAVNE